MRFAVAALGLLSVAATLVLAGAVAPSPAEPLFVQAEYRGEPLRSNLDLLGEVKVVVDKDDPLYRELAEDDAARGRGRTNWTAETGER